MQMSAQTGSSTYRAVGRGLYMGTVDMSFLLYPSSSTLVTRDSHFERTPFYAPECPQEKLVRIAGCPNPRV